MADFKVGDVVQLKSGGPLMTVTELAPGSGSGPAVNCRWFEATGKSFSEYFNVETVKPHRT